MSKEEELFNKIAARLSEKNNKTEASKMFGKPCIKIDGKAFACFFKEDMVFKLNGDDHTRAINLSDSVFFDPSERGRLMKEWVQVTPAHSSEWSVLAESAMNYVGATNK